MILGWFFFLPGVFLFKRLFSSKRPVNLKTLFLIPFLSLAITPVFFFLLSLINPQSLDFPGLFIKLAVLNFLFFSFSFKKPFPKIKIESKKEVFFLSSVSLLVTFLILFPYLKNHSGPFWSTYHFGLAGVRDTEKHLGLINQIREFGLPPQNPFILRQPLNYYYFYHLSAAVLSRLAGIRPELAHLLLSGIISCCSIFIASFFFRPLVTTILFLGYGFDFFPMIFALLKIHPYPGGLDHLDQWTIPFVQDLKINPFSVWFPWVPQHSLALFQFLILFGVFFEKIKIEPKFKPLFLSLLLFSILGTSFYIFFEILIIFFLYGIFELVKFKKFSFKKYSFFLLASPFILAFLLPMLARIKTPSLGLYSFWQLPRDHLFNWQFPKFPVPILIPILIFFLLERFFAVSYTHLTLPTIYSV